MRARERERERKKEFEREKKMTKKYEEFLSLETALKVDALSVPWRSHCFVMCMNFMGKLFLPVFACISFGISPKNVPKLISQFRNDWILAMHSV